MPQDFLDRVVSTPKRMTGDILVYLAAQERDACTLEAKMVGAMPLKRRKQLVGFALSTIAVSMLFACVPQSQTGVFGAPQLSRLENLSLDMSKPQVREAMGPPTAARGAIRTRYGEVVEVWEYRLYHYADSIPGLPWSYDDYWLYFVDGTLFQWGQAGDWRREADRIYEVRFR